MKSFLKIYFFIIFFVCGFSPALSIEVKNTPQFCISNSHILNYYTTFFHNSGSCSEGIYVNKQLNFSLAQPVGDSIIALYSTGLEPVVPNPATKFAKFYYTVKNESNVKIKIYDMFYKEIYTLIDEKKNAGRFEIYLNLEYSIPSGFYMVIMETENELFVQRLVVMK